MSTSYANLENVWRTNRKPEQIHYNMKSRAFQVCVKNAYAVIGCVRAAMIIILVQKFRKFLKK